MRELEKILEEIERKSFTNMTITHSMVVKMNDIRDIIRKHMNDRPCSECSRRKFYQAGYRDGKTDGWIPVEERLPEKYISVLVQWEKYDRHLNVTLTYLDVMWLDDAEEQVFETTNGVPNGKVIAWRPLPEPYRTERSVGE